MDIWFWSLRKERFSGRRHEEHSDDSEEEHRHAEDCGGKAHAWLLELPRRAGEEKHGGEEHGVGEILTGAIARLPRRRDSPHRALRHRALLRRHGGEV